MEDKPRRPLSKWVAIQIAGRLRHSTLPYAPLQINLSDLKPNGKLLTDAEIAARSAKDYAKLAVKEKRGPEGERAFMFVNSPYDPDKQMYLIMAKGVKHKGHLGKGEFGVVKLGQDIETGDWYAVKKIAINEKVPEGAAMLEGDMLHNAGQLEGEGHRIRWDHESVKNEFILVMKLAKGIELHQYLSKKSGPRKGPKLSISGWMDICVETTNAVLGLHARGVYHRDIKPENMVINPSTGEVTLADFGLAKISSSPDPEFQYGTPGFKAPEILEKGGTSEATEVYALGMTLADTLGFLDLQEAGLIATIDDFPLAKTRIPDDTFRADLLDFVRVMVSSDPASRPSMKDVAGFFDNAKVFCLEQMNNLKKVGLLDIGEYKNAGAAGQLRLANAMRAYDEIWPVDTKEAYKEDYAAIRRDLEKQNIWLSDKVFHGVGSASTTEIMQEIQASANKPESENFFEFGRVTDPAKKESSEIGPPQDIEGKLRFLQRGLKKEIKELEGKKDEHGVVDSCIEILEDGIEGFSDTQTFSEDPSLIEKFLEKLQKKLLKQEYTSPYLKNYMEKHAAQETHKPAGPTNAS